jgi:hypothetical protein
MAWQGSAAEHSASPILQQAYDQLLTVQYFGFGDIQRGWGGPYLISPGEQSLRTLVESSDGWPLLRATLTNGTTAAKLYALCAVQHLAPEEFDSLAAPLARTNSMVLVRVSWIGMALQTSNIVAQIKSSSYEEFLPPKGK